MNAREKPLAVRWDSDNTGQITIDGELWAAVEWSEKHQRWCIEDAAGKCLHHTCCTVGRETSKEAALILAEQMIRDGRMPDPQTARSNLEKRLQERRDKRASQPAQIRRRQEREARARQYSEALTNEWKARHEDEQLTPLYEVLAEAFDFNDEALWKSNSFAMIRPRLAAYMRHAVAKLEAKIAYEAKRADQQPFAMWADSAARKADRAARKQECERALKILQAKFERARVILRQLEGDA
jgi:hypothetical protein